MRSSAFSLGAALDCSPSKPTQERKLFFAICVLLEFFDHFGGAIGSTGRQFYGGESRAESRGGELFRGERARN